MSIVADDYVLCSASILVQEVYGFSRSQELTFSFLNEFSVVAARAFGKDVGFVDLRSDDFVFCDCGFA